jgi:hypothetical protein
MIINNYEANSLTRSILTIRENMSLLTIFHV